MNILFRLLAKFIKLINQTGEPKSSSATINHETVSAIKIKNNNPKQTSAASQEFISKKTGTSGDILTGATTMVRSETIGNNGTSMMPFASTAYQQSYDRPISFRGRRYDPRTFVEIDAEKLSDSELQDLLSSGANIAPVNISKGTSNLNESTAYKNPQLERMLDIIGKIK